MLLHVRWFPASSRFRLSLHQRALAQRRWRSGSRRNPGGLLVCDPLMAWSATASMGPNQLLDAIDRASRAGVGLEANAPELVLSLALLSDDGAVYDESYNPGDLEDEFGVQKLGTHAVLTANDVAMLLKAFSRFGYTKNPEAMEFLLQRAEETLEEATSSDVAQLLGAASRLGLGQELANGAMLERYFYRARSGLFDKFTPAADATNLCAAAALLPKTEEGAQLLAEMAGYLRKAEKAAALSPRRLSRHRVLRMWEDIVAVQHRLSRETFEEVCAATAEALAHRCAELDTETSLSALEALGQLLPHPPTGLFSPSSLDPVCALLLQRLRGPLGDEAARCAEASVKIQKEEDMDPDKKERWVDLIGNPRQRRMALERILDVANYVRDEDGKVYKDGASDESRARLEIDKSEGRLTISGRPEAIERAKELVLQEVSHCKLADGTILKDENRPMGPGGGPPLPGRIVHFAVAGKRDISRDWRSWVSGKDGFKLWVLGKEAGKVIGRGGETVREIMQRTGAEIQVERTENKDQGHAERLIQIFGSKSQIDEAFPMIIKDVTFARSELGLVKDPAMTPEEAMDALRTRGPGGPSGSLPPFPFPGGPPPPGAPPFFPPMPGMARRASWWPATTRNDADAAWDDASASRNEPVRAALRPSVPTPFFQAVPGRVSGAPHASRLDRPLSCAVLAALAVRVGAKSRSDRSRVPKLAQETSTTSSAKASAPPSKPKSPPEAKPPPQPKAKASPPVAAGAAGGCEATQWYQQTENRRNFAAKPIEGGGPPPPPAPKAAPKGPPPTPAMPPKAAAPTIKAESKAKAAPKAAPMAKETSKTVVKEEEKPKAQEPPKAKEEQKVVEPVKVDDDKKVLEQELKDKEAKLVSLENSIKTSEQEKASLKKQMEQIDAEKQARAKADKEKDEKLKQQEQALEKAKEELEEMKREQERNRRNLQAASAAAKLEKKAFKSAGGSDDDELKKSLEQVQTMKTEVSAYPAPAPAPAPPQPDPALQKQITELQESLRASQAQSAEKEQKIFQLQMEQEQVQSTMQGLKESLAEKEEEAKQSDPNVSNGLGSICTDGREDVAAVYLDAREDPAVLLQKAKEGEERIDALQAENQSILAELKEAKAQLSNLDSAQAALAESEAKAKTLSDEIQEIAEQIGAGAGLLSFFQQPSTEDLLRDSDRTSGDGATTSPVRIAGAIMTLSIILMDVYDHMLYKRHQGRDRQVEVEVTSARARAIGRTKNRSQRAGRPCLPVLMACHHQDYRLSQMAFRHTPGCHMRLRLKSIPRKAEKVGRALVALPPTLVAAKSGKNLRRSSLPLPG
eukprot:s293_g4.t3